MKAHNAAAKIAAGLAARGQSVVESVAQEENMSISASQRYAIMQKLARQEVEYHGINIVYSSIKDFL